MTNFRRFIIPAALAVFLFLFSGCVQSGRTVVKTVTTYTVSDSGENYLPTKSRETLTVDSDLAASGFAFRHIGWNTDTIVSADDVTRSSSEPKRAAGNALSEVIEAAGEAVPDTAALSVIFGGAPAEIKIPDRPEQ